MISKKTARAWIKSKEKERIYSSVFDYFDNILMSKYHDYCQPEHENTDSYQRNNHNSRFVQQHEALIEPTNDIHPRKRRRTSHCHYQYYQAQSKLLLVTRLLIFLVLCFLVYYTFISFYPKPKQTSWNRVWSSMLSKI